MSLAMDVDEDYEMSKLVKRASHCVVNFFLGSEWFRSESLEVLLLLLLLMSNKEKSTGN